MKYLDLAIANETIKTTDIKGKDYAEVNQRIKAFRMVYPQGIIQTEMLSCENGICVFKATAYDDNGSLLSTGHAYEKENSSFINKTSFIENCETSAIGRCLGIAGFGIDVSVASAEEVQNAINNQKITQEEADNYKFTFGKYKDKTLKEVYQEDSKYIEWMINNTKDERMLKLIELATGIEIPSEEESKERIQYINKINNLVLDTDTDMEDLYNYFKVSSLNELTIKQLNECIKILEAKLKKQEA